MDILWTIILIIGIVGMIISEYFTYRQYKEKIKDDKKLNKWKLKF